MDVPDDDVPELLKEIDRINMNKSFFNTILPSVEFRSKNIYEYLKDERAEYHRTSVNDQMKFHDPDVDYPDCI